ncbi:hypothetical protein ASG87_12445 [Frateuria sp. Soil773]|nr:hypothetical protein ASG87_12445 [Frateuria sp. Soil773]
MGVSASGKSTLGSRLAKAEGWDFLEGDDLHPAANIAKMKAGIALTDADRGPWLEALAHWIAGQKQARRSGVIACSALRRPYRDRLRAADPQLRLAYLQVPRAELAQRMRTRSHFMPPSLLDSQLATLEEPAPDEHALYLDGSAPIHATLAQLRRWLRPPA